MLGGFVGLELRDPTKRAQEISKGLEIGNYFQIPRSKLSYRADTGDVRRIEAGGHVDASMA